MSNAPLGPEFCASVLDVEHKRQRNQRYRAQISVDAGSLIVSMLPCHGLRFRDKLPRELQGVPLGRTAKHISLLEAKAHPRLCGSRRHTDQYLPLHTRRHRPPPLVPTPPRSQGPTRLVAPFASLQTCTGTTSQPSSACLSLPQL